jgi:hypothetical protein
LEGENCLPCDTRGGLTTAALLRLEDPFRFRAMTNMGLFSEAGARGGAENSCESLENMASSCHRDTPTLLILFDALGLVPLSLDDRFSTVPLSLDARFSTRAGLLGVSLLVGGSEGCDGGEDGEDGITSTDLFLVGGKGAAQQSFIKGTLTIRLGSRGEALSLHTTMFLLEEL